MTLALVCVGLSAWVLATLVAGSSVVVLRILAAVAFAFAALVALLGAP